MKKHKKILYIGNNLTKHTNYSTAMETLSNHLISDDFTVYLSSDKKNKLLRLIDMCFSIIKYQHKVSYILIDTFSTDSFYFSFITAQLASFFRKKYIPILHGGNLPDRIKRSPSMSKKLFTKSYKNIAPSHYLKEAFEKEGYAVDYIPNTLKIEDFQYHKRTKIQPRLLWVRAFKDIYNPTLAIEVLHLVKKEFPEAILCMVGPEKDHTFKEVLTLTKKYQLTDSVEFTGVLPKQEWHKKSTGYDVFMNTTNFDNTPVSIMEAMALGITIVSTNAGGMPFLIENNKEGILVEKNNSRLMAESIVSLIKDNNNQMAAKARLKAESFDWGIVKHQWFKIFQCV
ncbi:MAG: glycosyltransferase family 4 protein [Flavobacteriaceae bacterium]